MGWFNHQPDIKVADLSPNNILRKQSATDGTKLDLNIGGSPGFGGLIQGEQIYNPVGSTPLFLGGLTWGVDRMVLNDLQIHHSRPLSSLT